MSHAPEAHDDGGGMNLADSGGPDRSSPASEHASQDAPNAQQAAEVHSHDDSDHLSFAAGDMRARMTIALDDVPDGDMAALFEQKLSAEGASPKPCIVPGNALQLIDDDPAASRAHTPASVVVIDTDGHPTSVQPDSSGDPEHPHGGDPRPVPRVRFRSRVRITSGLRRSRQGTSGLSAGSPESSASDSPSSSISAPIRWQADENAAWGPLGQRLSSYAHHNGWQKRVPSGPRARADRPRVPQPRAKTDERTPLVRTANHTSYADVGSDGGGEADDERVVEGEFDSEDDDAAQEQALRMEALKREEDAVFGQWPWRFLNRHWWWWQIEPVLCCCWVEDSDFEQ